MTDIQELTTQLQEKYDRAETLKSRIEEGERMLNERLAAIERMEPGPAQHRFIKGFEEGLKKYERLCDEYLELWGKPVWCPPGATRLSCGMEYCEVCK